MRDAELKERTKQFALAVLAFIRELPSDRQTDTIVRQLMRSAMSVGANYRAACRARSRADFIAKMGVVEEEADESRYWLEILLEAGLIHKGNVEPLLEGADAILGMVVASIKTARKTPMANSALRTPHSAPHSTLVHGSAMIEFAMTSILLMVVMAAMLRFGLNFDAQQQADMKAFREALKIAVNPNTTGGATYTLVEDHYAADPTNPFAIGSALPVVATGNVTRDNHLDETAEFTKPNELPRMQIVFQGKPFDCPSPGQGCTLAGFKTYDDITEDQLNRIEFVLGGVNVCSKADCGSEDDFPKKIIAIDSGYGELIDKQTLEGQAKLWRDDIYCELKCTQGKSPDDKDTNCSKDDGLCSETLPDVPWYAEGTEDPTTHFKGGSHTWTFPNLDALFPQNKALAIQPGYTKQVLSLSPNVFKLTKTQTGGGSPQLTTTDSMDWTEKTTRDFTYIGQDVTGTDSDPHTVLRTTESVESVSKDQHDAWTWTTPSE